MTPDTKPPNPKPLLAELRRASRELARAVQRRTKAKRALAKAEELVKEARRRLRLVEQAFEPETPSPVATCQTCGAQAGTTATCTECSAYRSYLQE